MAGGSSPTQAFSPLIPQIYTCCCYTTSRIILFDLDNVAPAGCVAGDWPALCHVPAILVARGGKAHPVAAKLVIGVIDNNVKFRVSGPSKQGFLLVGSR